MQGAAVGGGLGLALSADFRVASPETRFSCNFARLGFHQGFGISVTLPAVVGQQRALELMFTAADVRGEEAHRIGLADRLVAADELRGAAQAFATEIAASAPLALLSIRETIRGDLAGRVERATAREEQRAAAAARHRRLPRGCGRGRRAAATELHGPVVVPGARRPGSTWSRSRAGRRSHCRGSRHRSAPSSSPAASRTSPRT